MAARSFARRIAACRPWAQTWERNWYPGDIGGEVPPNYRPDVFESNRVRQGDPETVLIEACAALGPGTVLTARTVVDNLRMRTAQGADSIATASIKTLMSFAEIASGLGAVTPALWGKAAATDVLRRAGHEPVPIAGGGGALVFTAPAGDAWRIELGPRRVVGPTGAIDLSSGEFDLLLALAERPQRVLSRDQLLDLTKGRAAQPFDRAIDVQIGRLRRKIERDPADPRLITTVRGGGYLFAAPVSRVD